MPESIVLLHGFSGTYRAWDGVVAHIDAQRYRPLALDLPGHGGEARPGEAVTIAVCVQSVLERAPMRFVLAGYSMGARIALQVALTAPGRVARLILIGASPGIEDAAEREQRRRADRRLAEELEEGPFDEWIERWRAQPVFAGEPPDAAALARADQRRNDPHALAAVLRGTGTGEMEPVWGRLGELTMPVTVVAGARDEKFLGIGRRMASLLPDGDLVVLAGGHGLPLENPAALAAAIEGREL